ncbi:unnamed protein product [Paramecium primaurelia]|uniref:Uncharacterized protein n=1 Tax=Paramecium primaurelia TaxID=5886 RepID=A0A8S1LL41_PARPR|nr:unnamed protein product [Paramecium primaurelia]
MFNFNSQFYVIFNSEFDRDVYRKTHAMTIHISNPEKSFSFQSQQSERNDTNRRATSNIVNPIQKQNTFQQFSYITQIMLPDYEKNINTISIIENKAYQIQPEKQDDQKQKKNLDYGERWINYNFENHPIELQSYVINIQKVRQQEFYYYKISCQGQTSPLKFSINQSEATKFKIFLSTTNPYPSKFSCEQIFQVKTWKYDCKDSQLFQQAFIYISMVFALESIIKISFSFGTNKGMYNTQWKSPQTKQTQIKQNLSASSYFINQRKINQLQKGRNLIQGNILNVSIQNDEDYKSQKLLQRTIQEKKYNQVINKRKQFEINTQGQKQINYFTKEISYLLKKIKQKKQQKYLDQNGHLKQKIQFEIFRLFAYLQCLSLIYEKLTHQRQILYNFQKIQAKITTIYFRTKRNICKMKGYTLFGRVHFDVKLCLQMFTKQIQKKARIQSINLIQSILTKRSFLWNFQKQIHQTSKQLQYIKQSIYNFIIRYRIYRSFLRQMFERHFDQQCQIFIINKDLKIQQCFEFWHRKSKYLMYYQYLSKQFAIIYGRLNLNNFYSFLRKNKQTKYQQIGFNLLQEFHLTLYKVPLQQDFQQIIPILYQLTQNEASQYCKDSFRKPFNKLQF